VLPSDIEEELPKLKEITSILEEELMTWDYDMIPNQGVANE
jgi:hypothetical protein